MPEQAADTLRQYIDAVSVFEAHEEALAEAAHVRGGMYWHQISSGTRRYLSGAHQCFR